MDISCNIIRDLLPLYAEDMVSEDSKLLVDEHLCGCEECTRQLGIMMKVSKLPMEVDTESLKRVENTIRRRRILAMVTVLLFVFTLGMSGAMLLDAKVYLSAEQAVVSVEGREDGSVVLNLNDCVNGVRASKDMVVGNYGIIAWSKLSTLLFRDERTSYEDLSTEYQMFYSKDEYEEIGRFILSQADEDDIWYCSALSGKAQTQLWGEDAPIPTGQLMPVDYLLAYYCAALIAGAVMLTLAGREFKGKWYGEMSVRLAILCGCLCLSTVIVTAGQFMELNGEFTGALVDSTAVAPSMALTVLMARQLHRLNKQDKGL